MSGHQILNQGQNMEPPVHSAVSVSTLTVSVKNSQLVLLYFLLVSIVNKDT